MLDRFGSKRIVVSGAALLAVGMGLLGGSVDGSLALWIKIVLFIVAGLVVGAGLSALLGAPMRYIMLNEVAPEDRGSAQAMITIFGSVGQLVSGALVGAVAASAGGGVSGYRTSYLVVAVVALALTAAALGLKGRADELQAIQRSGAEMTVQGA